MAHPLARAPDGRQQGQDAREEDTRGHGEISPSERDPTPVHSPAPRRSDAGSAQ